MPTCARCRARKMICTNKWQVGLFWSQLILGGQVMPFPKLSDSWPVAYYIHEWPTIGPLETHYKLNLRGPPLYTFDWLLDLRHVAMLQDQRFWSSLLVTSDHTVLRFSKYIGNLKVPDEKRIRRSRAPPGRPRGFGQHLQAGELAGETLKSCCSQQLCRRQRVVSVWRMKYRATT